MAEVTRETARQVFQTLKAQGKDLSQIESQFAALTPEQKKQYISKAADRLGIGAAPEPTPAPEPQEPEGPSLAQRGAGVAIGAAEAMNPLSVPRSVEEIGRALGKTFRSAKPQETPTGLIVPVEQKGFLQSLGEASREAVMPDLSVQRGVSMIPGGKELVEQTGTEQLIGGLIPAAAGLYKGVKGVVQGKPTAALLEKQAAKQAKKAATLTKKIVRDDSLIESILQNPDDVAKVALGEQGAVQYTAAGPKGSLFNDLADEIGKELLDIQKNLRIRVGEFRKIAQGNQTRIIEADDVRDALEGAKRTVRGESLLESSELSKLDKLLGYLKPESSVNAAGVVQLEKKISPNEALEIVDKIDQLNLDTLVDKGNISRKFANDLFGVRKTLKERVRDASEMGKQWAEADDNLSKFIDNSGSLINKFTGTNKESATGNLFGKGKTPIREQLAAALDAAKAIDSKGGSRASEFFERLQTLRSGEALRRVELQRIDPDADKITNIIDSYERNAARLGRAIGAGAGASSGGFLGAIVGTEVGGSMLGMAGRALGVKVADPRRILTAASKAKTLSAEAKKLASDALTVGKSTGPEGIMAFMQTVAPFTPAVNELGQFIRAQNQNEGLLGAVQGNP